MVDFPMSSEFSVVYIKLGEPNFNDWEDFGGH